MAYDFERLLRVDVLAPRILEAIHTADIATIVLDHVEASLAGLTGVALYSLRQNGGSLDGVGARGLPTGAALALACETAARERRLVQSDAEHLAIPLISGRQSIGVMALSFAPGQAPAGGQQALVTFATLAAQALDRSRLYEAEEAESKREAFLANSSALLARSLDPGATLEQLAALAIPEFADWCAIDAIENGAVVLQAVAHADPAMVQFAYELRRRVPPSLDDAWGIPEVIRSGRSELYASVPDALRPEQLESADVQEVTRALAIRSVMIVPIPVRGGIFGAISFVWSTPGRAYGPRDLALAEELARHAGLALENSALYEAEHRARASAERAVDLLTRLQEASTKIAATRSRKEVAEALAREARTTLGAPFSALWLLSEDGSALELWSARSNVPELMTPFERIELDGSLELPAIDALRKGPVWFASAQELLERYPTLALDPGLRDYAGAVLPLQVEGRSIGVFSLNLEPGRVVTAEERGFLSVFVAQAAQSLERARLHDEALAAVGLRDDFLAIAGHELRTPLTAMILQLEALARDGGCSPARAARLKRQSARLARLVDELLDVSRITSGRLRLEIEPVELGPLVREMTARAAEDLTRAGCKLVLEMENVPAGNWDRLRIEQVVSNLLQNATKYGAGRPVFVRVQRVGDRARLTVRDQGIGIAPADQERIFGRFERAASSRAFGGLGLGLWIVVQIVEAHGGTIGVESKAGEGATFTVELPLAA